jgi:lipopolysaccharide/colanic/teichoic acid biosynthesis glycosyltransferase
MIFEAGPDGRVDGDLRIESAREALVSAWTWTDVAKRALDLVLGTLLVLLLTPALLVVAILVAISSPGAVVFRQERVGRDREPFVMLKFRTMLEGAGDEIHRDFVINMFRGNGTGPAEGDGAGPANELHKLIDDPRVTGIGRILRRLSLDELPQLFNVLAGQMSLVGPRPALPWEIELFSEQHLVRFDVKPGITGLWQVSGRSTLTMVEALELDAAYVERRRFGLDLWILLRTLPLVFTGRGAT